MDFGVILCRIKMRTYFVYLKLKTIKHHTLTMAVLGINHGYLWFTYVAEKKKTAIMSLPSRQLKLELPSSASYRDQY